MSQNPTAPALTQAQSETIADAFGATGLEIKPDGSLSAMTTLPCGVCTLRARISRYDGHLDFEFGNISEFATFQAEQAFSRSREGFIRYARSNWNGPAAHVAPVFLNAMATLGISMTFPDFPESDDGAAPPLNPHTTILVVKCDGREVGSIPATAPNASAYLDEMAQIYGKQGQVTVDYKADPTGGLLAAMHGGR